MKKIAVPTRDSVVDDHFGHCAYYTVFTVDDNGKVLSEERLESPQGCGCKSEIASEMESMGITLMLAGNMGMGAFNKLSSHHITVIRGCHGKIQDVLSAYLNGELRDSSISCDHHECSHTEFRFVQNKEINR
ncbi:MAG: NifB/NifX family molybdenum-iron cluster-binding protein [Bacteroidales bacterium]|nr:NifB/NifX family molybdenum-iron cluster-binding protein [Bacteroidales bacterium]